MKARVIVTETCHRSCSYCCNDYPETMAGAIKSFDRRDLIEYNEIILTGGEPMLYPGYTIGLAKYLKSLGIKVYLYTTVWKSWFSKECLKTFDGIHYTLHAPLHLSDISEFCDFQRDIKGQSGSYRTYIDPDIDRDIPINPSLFSRIESKPWLADGECPVPEDDLIILEEK